MLEPIIELDIALDRGSFALQAALQLEQTVAGTVVGLFGPSGSGKSTLLGILAGTIKPDRGRIVVNGRCLLDTARGVDVAIHQRRVGLVFQDSKLFPHLTVKRNLQYGLKLLAKADQRFGSGADRRAAGTAAAAATAPPASFPAARNNAWHSAGHCWHRPNCCCWTNRWHRWMKRLKRQILPFLRRVKEQIRVPMIYVSHSINEILDLTQQLAVIDRGAILAHGDFHQIITVDKVLSLAHSLGAG